MEQLKADKGVYSFHVDGSKREHHSTNQQDTNDHSPVGIVTRSFRIWTCTFESKN